MARTVAQAETPTTRRSSSRRRGTKVVTDSDEDVASTPVKRTRKPKQAQKKQVEQTSDDDDDASPVEPVVKKKTTKSPVKTPIKSPVKSPTVSSTRATNTSIAKVSPLGADHDGTSRCKSFFQRLWAGLALFALFCGGIHLGHTILIPVIFIIQFMMYKEMVDLSYTHLLQDADKHLIPLFSVQNWYWFVAASYYAYSRLISIYTSYVVPEYLFVSGTLFFIGFVGFVLSLDAKTYRVQFANLAWTILSLLIFIIVETAVTVSVMFHGLIWLVLPAILIMTNDTWAYIWGVLFGKHSLIQLSVKKTWEGFFGALISTPIQGWLMTRYMVPYNILVCPQSVLFTFEHPQCIVSPLYQLTPTPLPFTIPILGWDHVLTCPMMYHALILSLFASIVAPFGGFFASGFKRAYAIKDFGTLIPGHGGFVDRMDCQLVMGIFIYIYFYTFIQPTAIVQDNVDANTVFKLYEQLDAAAKIAFKSML